MKKLKSKFELQKADAMKRLEKGVKRGEVDLAIFPLIKKVNFIQGYYTTSSCAGRIVIFHDLGSKRENDWLGKWHREVEFNEVNGVLKELPKEGIVWFMYEPAIIHVVARNLEGAVELMNMARNSGFKKIGIQSCKPERFLVEICSTERIDSPLAEGGEILVDENYVRYLVKLGNEKFQKGQKKLKRLEKAVGLLKQIPNNNMKIR